eukprot:TRINITY_DN15816_c0_g3_i2.p1 TRINITY_DN15816_c0_g3~~TRINITY_DN15816_c0_g3_i2.p1  ORF type:complete len:517 (+),score=191.80 TRINITY_DN15816_c0_g3_i2:50-1600(+)
MSVVGTLVGPECKFDLKVGTWTIGRKNADFTIKGKGISGTHAVIEVKPDSVHIKDMKSSNKTYINLNAEDDDNDETVPCEPHKLYKLKDGDAINLGSLRLNLSLPLTFPPTLIDADEDEAKPVSKALQYEDEEEVKPAAKTKDTTVQTGPSLTYESPDEAPPPSARLQKQTSTGSKKDEKEKQDAPAKAQEEEEDEDEEDRPMSSPDVPPPQRGKKQPKVALPESDDESDEPPKPNPRLQKKPSSAAPPKPEKERSISSSPPRADEAQKAPSAAAKADEAPAKKGSQKQVEDSEEDEPAPKKAAKRPAESDEESDEKPAPKKAAKRPEESDEESEERPAPKKKAGERPAPKKAAKRPAESDEESDEKPAPKKKAPNGKKAPMKRDESDDDESEKPKGKKVESESESDEESDEKPKGKKRVVPGSLSSKAKWYWQSDLRKTKAKETDDSAWTAYSAKDNKIIEEAYQSKKKNMKLKSNNRSYVVDFKEMIQYREDDDNLQRPIKREAPTTSKKPRHS